jgi:hypothetical protein
LEGTKRSRNEAVEPYEEQEEQEEEGGGGGGGGYVGLERSPLYLVRIIEELFQGNSGSGLEIRN